MARKPSSKRSPASSPVPAASAPSCPIRILEHDNNRRGDLFGRLMADLFLALGYEQPRMNVHKSGRELDLVASHRLEPRVAIGECKATAAPIGGDDLNKFVGALDAEDAEDTSITGYFISLSGFRETALEQENNRRRTRIILLNAEQVVRQLIDGNMIKPAQHATELAGRCCTAHPHLELDGPPQLLAHERGWIWAVHYAQGKTRTHFVLIHADGTPLALPLAQEIVASDQACSGTLHHLTCLNQPPVVAANVEDAELAARAAYAHYISEECGHLQLDGLPADGEVGSRRLRLENLFVPLHVVMEWRPNDEGTRRPAGALLIPSSAAPPPPSKDRRPVSFAHHGTREVDQQSPAHGVEEPGIRLYKSLDAAFMAAHTQHQIPPFAREALGAVLARHPRLALLAPPGGGKSTLLKRLAIAYADAGRRPDDLPERDWLPLFFRCRELRTLARASFAELLHALSQREPVRHHAAAFCALADRALVQGRVLLLVDGLDEIPDTGDRSAFVCTLRTALQAYPGTALVITSREAGFRHVAPHLAAICSSATIAPFDAADIRRLCVAWHAEVVGASESVRADAEALAATIAANDRIQLIAVNPLLLTTLLLVKRWVGTLPTRRAVLYGKAVEVLLMTWNTEGHEPIPEEEALPQLCYVAAAMMTARVQRISRPRLAELLQAARDALPTELGYVKGTVAEFIHRVEDRSSLLMMTGHDIEDGRLVEFYEFRHLTFQEFLTARAMVEGWYPGRSESDTLASMLEPRFDDDKWWEVIPLAASLGGRATEALIQKLTQRLNTPVEGLPVEETKSPDLIEFHIIDVDSGYRRSAAILGRCLIDEAAASPKTIRSAMQALVQRGLDTATADFDPTPSYVPGLLRGRYASALLAEAEDAFMNPEQIRVGAKALATIALWETRDEEAEAMESPIRPFFLSPLGPREVALGSSPSATALMGVLRSSDKLAQCRAALGLAQLLARWPQRDTIKDEDADKVVAALLPLLLGDEPHEHFASLSILTALHISPEWLPPSTPDLLGHLFTLGCHSPLSPVREMAWEALGNVPLPSREEGHGYCSTVCKADVDDQLCRLHDLATHEAKVAALIVAWYTRSIPDAAILEQVKELLPREDTGPRSIRRVFFHLRHEFGLPGLLEKLGVAEGPHSPLGQPVEGCVPDLRPQFPVLNVTQDLPQGLTQASPSP